MAMPQPQSQLHLNAPPFQPAAGHFVDQRHRKVASLGNPGLSSNFKGYSPHLGSMMEDAEDSTQYEDGEIREARFNGQQAHNPRAQSQSFVPPRFAALAQQEQDHAQNGRPQLAPNFTFGVPRKQGGPLGPPINEEDLSFQFPQQQQQPSYSSDIGTDDDGPRGPGNPPVNLLAEHVCVLVFV